MSRLKAILTKAGISLEEFINSLTPQEADQLANTMSGPDKIMVSKANRNRKQLVIPDEPEEIPVTATPVIKPKPESVPKQQPPLVLDEPAPEPPDIDKSFYEWLAKPRKQVEQSPPRTPSRPSPKKITYNNDDMQDYQKQREMRLLELNRRAAIEKLAKEAQILEQPKLSGNVEASPEDIDAMNSYNTLLDELGKQFDKPAKGKIRKK